jgi:signal transduction histidine kinase
MSTSPPDAMMMGRRPRLAIVAVITGAALTMAAIHATQAYLRGPVIGRPVIWFQAFLGSAPVWLVGAALTPAAGWAANRLRHERIGWPLRIALHLLGCALFILVWTGVLAQARVIGGDVNDLATEMRVFLTSSLVYQFAFYWGIVATTHAWAYFGEARSRAIAAADLRTKLSEAKLEVLRRQLDPHFLFNSLNTVSALALAGQGDRAAETVGLLSDLLRSSIHEHAAAEVPLDQELEFVRRYLAIQQIRFGDQLETIWSVDTEVRQAVVPSLLLQPLVENAVIHGVIPRQRPRTIWLRCGRLGNRLCLDVEDNGPGVCLENPEGLGLANLRARLTNSYPGNYRLECRNRATGGAMVHVDIPFRTR